jgi:hypothetical protein
MSKMRAKPPGIFGPKIDPQRSAVEDDRSLARFLELADIALKTNRADLSASLKREALPLVLRQSDQLLGDLRNVSWQP